MSLLNPRPVWLAVIGHALAWVGLACVASPGGEGGSSSSEGDASDAASAAEASSDGASSESSGGGEPGSSESEAAESESSDASSEDAGSQESEADEGTSTEASSSADAMGQESEGDDSGDEDTNAQDKTAAQAVAEIQIGWNLGNSLDVPEGETAWGNPEVTEALIEAVADAGFGGIRIPVTWSLHLGSAPDFTIEPAWLDRVEEVVGFATSRELYAIINLHHDGADEYEGVEWLTLNDESGAVTEENNAAVQAQFVAVWEQIASRFADHGHHLVFESMNEIHDGYDEPDPVYHDIINDLNQTFVDLVRASGGNNATRILVVPGYNTNIDHTVTGFEPPVDTIDDRLILSVHYYDPYEFALNADPPVWGEAFPESPPWGLEDWVREQFQTVGETYVAQGLPVIVGEYGATHLEGYEEYRRYYVEYVTKAATDAGAVPFYWDNGGPGSGPDNFALFDRATETVLRPEILEAILRASSSDYALEDVEAPVP